LRATVSPSSDIADPLRVLFVVGDVGSGGAEGQLVELLARCRPAVEPALATLSVSERSGPVVRRLRDAGVRHVVLSPPRGPKPLRASGAIARLERTLRSFRPHVCSPWLEETGLLVIPAARVHAIPVVLIRQNVAGSPAERSPVLRWAIREVEPWATLVVGNSQAVLEAAERRGISRSRLRLVENGHIVTAPLPMPSGPEAVLGYVAQFRPEKGHLRLLEALSRIETSSPWRVDLAGDGPLLERVKTEAEQRGLGDRVRTVGHVSDIQAFWAERDVAVLLSDFEGSPNALIEASMAGRPMVATDQGGTTEIVAPGTGFLVPVDDPGGTAAALERLIDDRALRAQMGDAAHAHVVRRFSMDQFVAGQIEALREAAASSSGTRRGFGHSRR
jgi:glycosyltransferase involved in cell wall biosynthesis